MRSLRSPLFALLVPSLLALAMACASEDDPSESGPVGVKNTSGGKGGSAGSAGKGGGGSAQAGSAQAGSGGSAQAGSAQAGKGGSSQAGQGGSAQAGSGGSSQAGGGGSPQAGSGGSSQAGQGGSSQAGSGGSSQAGSAQAGSGGSSQAGSGGTSSGGGPTYPSCACLAGVDNFCNYPKDTPGCPMLQGGYCDPSAGAIQWEKGYYEYKDACGSCGNGACEGHESKTVCPKDCGSSPACGNDICDAGETMANCPHDCGTNAVCGDGVCGAPETTASCPADCPPPNAQEPDRLLGIHFWDNDAKNQLGTDLYYDVEAFASPTDPNTIVSWLKDREATGARGIVRIDYNWGHSVPQNDGEQAEYNGRLVAIAKAIAAAGLKTHHFIVGNESNLPGEGGASAQQAGKAFVSAKKALDAAGPFPYPPVVMPSPPSTAAEFGGGDGSYLRDELSAIKAAGVTPAAIALHAYENPDSDGSGNLFMATVTYQAKAVADVGLQGIPLFVTEYNMAMLDSSWETKGAAFVAASAKRLDAWNKGGEGNPSPGKLFVVSTCYFVWSNDPNWPMHSLQNHPPLRDAFKAAWGVYKSGKAY